MEVCCVKKYYSEPLAEIREYVYIEGSVLTASQPETQPDNGLDNDDIYDIFA